MFVTAIRQVGKCLPGSGSAVELFHTLDERSLLFFKKLDIFFAIGSVIRSALLSIHADGVVETTSVALTFAIALWRVSGKVKNIHCFRTLIFRILHRSHALETLFARDRKEESGDSAS